MAQNYAAKYDPKVVERFKLASKTDDAFSTDYSWLDVQTIKLYSVTVPSALNDYDRNANANRFGTPTEVDTTLQTLTLTQDKGLEQIVDFGNLADSGNAQAAGKHMRRVVDELVTPTIDIYRLGVLDTAAASTGKNAVVTAGATSSTNAYSNFLSLQESLSNDKVPLTNRYAFMTQGYYNNLKQSGYVLASEIAMGQRQSGDLGTIDGVKIVVVPASYMPTNVDLQLTHKSAQVGPVKLKNMRVLEGQQGYDGNILQWRFFYDAFVLTQLNKAVAEHKTA